MLDSPWKHCFPQVEASQFPTSRNLGAHSPSLKLLPSHESSSFSCKNHYPFETWDIWLNHLSSSHSFAKFLGLHLIFTWLTALFSSPSLISIVSYSSVHMDLPYNSLTNWAFDLSSNVLHLSPLRLLILIIPYSLTFSDHAPLYFQPSQPWGPQLLFFSLIKSFNPSPILLSVHQPPPTFTAFSSNLHPITQYFSLIFLPACPPISRAQLHPNLRVNLVIDLLSSCLSQLMILVNITQPSVLMPLKSFGFQTQSCLFSVCPKYWLPFLWFYDKPPLLLMSIFGGLIWVHPACLSVPSILHEMGLI